MLLFEVRHDMIMIEYDLIGELTEGKLGVFLTIWSSIVFGLDFIRRLM